MTGDHNFTTFDEVIDFWAKERPDGPAFEQDGRITSYSQLDDITRRIITLLQQRGVAPGDRINWLGKNRDTYFMIYLAVARCGIVMVPIGWRLAPAEIAYIVEDTGSSLIFADDEFSDVARDVANRVAAKPEVLTVSQVEKLLPDQAPADYQPAGEHDPVLQLYTSGTTSSLWNDRDVGHDLAPAARRSRSGGQRAHALCRESCAGRGNPRCRSGR